MEIYIKGMEMPKSCYECWAKEAIQILSTRDAHDVLCGYTDLLKEY